MQRNAIVLSVIGFIVKVDAFKWCNSILIISLDPKKKIKLKGSAILMTHRIRIDLHLKITISSMQEPKLWNQMRSFLYNIFMKPSLTSWSTLEYQKSAGTVNKRQRKCSTPPTRGGTTFGGSWGKMLEQALRRWKNPTLMLNTILTLSKRGKPLKPREVVLAFGRTFTNYQRNSIIFMIFLRGFWIWSADLSLCQKAVAN